ncbi:MAG TPA: hypothetical protein VMC83_05415 [Streptosporangiaceae bacterium]|nr:hypothetical protein [Streptosporangiaceae bacterium]
MTTSQEYLEAYDRQLRTDAETPSAIAVERLGPLRLVTFAGGRGFVTYQDLGGADAVTIAGWVGEALAHYRADAAITRVEWKTRRMRCCGGWPPGTACSCGWRRPAGRSSAPGGSSRSPGPSSPGSGAGPRGRGGGAGGSTGP